MREENRVIIRIWTSKCNKAIPGENVGHIALQTPLGYMSFWPKGHSSGGFSKFFEKRPPHYMGGYESDEEAEERKPEITVCLYSLNVEEMQKEFDDIKQKVTGWTLLGSNKLINHNSAESCASLAYRLLKAGGIYELIPFTFSSKVSSVASPDALADAVLRAKKEEKKLYPEIIDFHFEGEILFEDKHDSKCLTM